MSKLTRRQLLVFFGASAGTAVLAPTLGDTLFSSNSSIAQTVEPLKFTPVRLPHPLPIYTEQPSYYVTEVGNAGTVLDPKQYPNAKLDEFTVVDDVVVPPEYERYVIVRWGDRVYPDRNAYQGFNHDYTSFILIDRSANDGFLVINHEYVGFPFSDLAPGTPSNLRGFPIAYTPVIGRSLPTGENLDALNPQDRRLLFGEFMYNLGVSAVRITRENRSGRFAVNKDYSRNRQIHGLSGLGINRERTDGYQNVTSWGSLSYQQGDDNYLVGTGPAATDVFPLSSDGLGNRIIGTGYNCAGGTSPWGTILSAEENFQASSSFFVGVTEPVNANGTQNGYTEGTTGAEFGLVGEKYGYMVEVDPADPSFRPRKHTALGRFRHESIALRVEAGKQLVGYMGDDRRGGHTWKFVSSGIGEEINCLSSVEFWVQRLNIALALELRSHS